MLRLRYSETILSTSAGCTLVFVRPPGRRAWPGKIESAEAGSRAQRKTVGELILFEPLREGLEYHHPALLSTGASRMSGRSGLGEGRDLIQILPNRFSGKILVESLQDVQMIDTDNFLPVSMLNSSVSFTQPNMLIWNQTNLDAGTDLAFRTCMDRPMLPGGLARHAYLGDGQFDG